MSQNTLLNWALHYSRQGLSIFPVREKLPLVKWKEFQERCASEEEIKAWWTQWPDADIGCVTGKITGRLVLDIDGPEGRASILGKLLPITPSVRTRRGAQFHFRWNENCVSKTTLAALLPGVDVRGEGGYVKLPPSKCSDGSRYSWFIGRSFTELPLALAPEWLMALISKPKSQYTEKVTGPVKEKWLAEILEGVGEGGRHQALVKLAGWYFSRMPADVAEMHIREWNQKNQPPYDDFELNTQIADLKRKYSKDYDKFNEPVNTKEEESMTSMDLDEFLTTGNPHIDWLVPGLIPKKSANIIGGMQGLGKSWMTLDLAIEMAHGGGHWLGMFPVEGGAVLYIDEESADQLLRFRLKKLMAGKGYGALKHRVKLCVNKGLNLSDGRSVDRLRELLTEVKPKLVIIDSLIRSHTADENSATEMKKVFRTVKFLMEEFDTTFVFIDHERKPSQFDTASSQRLRGSSEKGAFIDTLISLRAQAGNLVVEHSKSRYAKPTPKFGLLIEDVNDNAVQVKHIGYLNVAS